MTRSYKTATLPDRVTVDQAFQFLRQQNIDPHKACAVLDDAICTNEIYLEGEENGKPFAINPVSPSFFKQELRIEPIKPRTAADGRWHAAVAAQRNCKVDYDWFLSPGSAIEALLTQSPAHAGGRPRVYRHEDILIEAAVYISTRKLPKDATDFYADIAEILG